MVVLDEKRSPCSPAIVRTGPRAHVGAQAARWKGVCRTLHIEPDALSAVATGYGRNKMHP